MIKTKKWLSKSTAQTSIYETLTEHQVQEDIEDAKTQRIVPLRKVFGKVWTQIVKCWLICQNWSLRQVREFMIRELIWKLQYSQCMKRTHNPSQTFLHCGLRLGNPIQAHQQMKTPWMKSSPAAIPTYKLRDLGIVV